jgi:hypothetical protein
MPASPGSTPAHRPATASDRQLTAPAGTTRSQPDPIAVSPALGPLPAIYVPPPGQPGPAGLLGRAAARAARLGLRWATRQHRRNHVRDPR